MPQTLEKRHSLTWQPSLSMRAFAGSEQAKTLQMQVVALQERVRELELAAKNGQESGGLYVPLGARVSVQILF